jgi:hypothetical protein
MHGTVDDIGAVEGRARAERELTTVRTGDNAMRFDGAGYHQIMLPVDTTLTTVTVYGRYDATYSGTLPQLKVNGYHDRWIRCVGIIVSKFHANKFRPGAYSFAQQ